MYISYYLNQVNLSTKFFVLQQGGDQTLCLPEQIKYNESNFD